MPRPIWLVGAHAELIQISRSFSISRLKAHKETSGEWVISAYYDGKNVSTLEGTYPSEAAAMDAMMQCRAKIDKDASAY